MFSVNILITLVGSFFVHAAAANSDLLWNGQRGFLPAVDCEVTEQAEIPFRTAILRKNALVKIVGLRVSQVSDNSEVNLPAGTLRDLADQVLEIKIAPDLKIGKNNAKLVGSFWQVAMEGQKFITLDCGTKSYALFDVFTKDDVDPVARVGVSVGDAQIFRSVIAHTADEAEKAVTAQAEIAALEQNSAASTSIMASSRFVTAAGKKHRIKNAKPATVAPLVPVTNVARVVRAQPHDGNLGTTQASSVPKPSVAPAVVAPGSASTPAVVPAGSSLDYVVCIKDDVLQVRAKNLKDILFGARKLEVVKPLQSFGTEKQTRVISGKSYSFINVKFDGRPQGQNTGWVADAYIKLKSQCNEVSAVQPDPPKQEEQSENGRSSGDRDFSKIKGLNDENCCEFPVMKRPTTSYLEGMRRFRASRSGGRRLHAACDLYRTRNENIVAVAPGTVLRKYAFYQGTAVMEVRHAGGFIVLYGEITFKNAPGASPGSTVKAGQLVGYMGKVNSNCCEPMLHFELYSGAGRGPMLKGPNAFIRRSDLMNPTAYLQRWEKAKFGQSF